MIPIKTKQELIEIIQSYKDIIKTYGVVKLGIFGSFVRNEADDNSDIDLFIEFDPKFKTLKNFVHLANFLENISGRKVEIIT
ncbi:MAG: nucleotidyltransferase, partial [Bacteroidetes bacterium]|nr:nucleotidyltransferase [Bacteroidota bacterium]